MRIIPVLSMRDFDELIDQARRQAKRSGMKNWISPWRLPESEGRNEAHS
jgi:hypothetical protein